MIPCSPHSSTSGTGEWTIRPTVVFRLAGQVAIGPSDEDQSYSAMRRGISPSVERKEITLPVSAATSAPTPAPSPKLGRDQQRCAGGEVPRGSNSDATQTSVVFAPFAVQPARQR